MSIRKQLSAWMLTSLVSSVTFGQVVQPVSADNSATSPEQTDATAETPQVTTKAPPLPQHPDRKPTNPADTRPKAARPDRGEPHEARPAAQRMPIPAQPARDLPEIGEPADPEAAPETLLDFLPHSGPHGALQGEFVYTGETFTLAHGGITNRNRTNYRGNLDMVLTLDLEVAAGWEGGRIFVYGNNVHGEPLSQNYVGDMQLFSNIDSTISDTARPRYTAVAEYWYEQLLLEDHLRCKFGKQDANADFAYSDVGGDFIHSSFGLPPTIPLPTFPSQALGASFFLAPVEEATFGFGVYDGTPAFGPQGVRAGFDTLGHNGAIMLGQLQLLNQLGPNGQLPSTLRIGGWYHTGDDLFTSFEAVPRTFRNNYGGWIIGDQMLWKEEYGTDDAQGLAGFFMLSGTPSDRNVIDHSLGAGLVYRGFFANRDEDALGAGVAMAALGDDYRAFELANGNPLSTKETTTEVFYKIQLKPAVTLQPEIQFISSPSGQFSDALLYGLRFEAVL